MQKKFYLNLQITTNSIQIPYNIVQNLYKKRITSFYRSGQIETGMQLRKLFATLLLFCEVTRPEVLWEKISLLLVMIFFFKFVIILEI